MIDEAKAPTCTETGLTAGQHCSRCDDETVAQQVVDALGHNAGAAATCTTAQTCTRCDYVFQEALGHSFVAGNCERCGVSDGHTCDYDAVVTDPTCTAAGYTTYTCRVCGDTYTDNETAALGHTWTDATCLAPKTCSACGATEGEALGHNIVIDEAKAPTCTETGLTAGQHCSRCSDKTVKQNVVEALGHKAGAAATCTTAQTCTRCDYVFQEALGHSWVAATCTTPKTCSACGATEGAALGHTWVDASCTAPKTCSECEATEGKANGHTGNDVGVCTVCAENLVISVEEAIEIGLSYANSKYSNEYYYVKLTITESVNTTNNLGFTRAKVRNDLYFSIAGGYLTSSTATAVKTGDTVIYKAKLGAASSNMIVTGGREPRLYEIASYKVVSASHTHAYSDIGVCDICGHNCVISVEEAIAKGITYDKGKYSTEFYYVALTLNTQVNPNGFARTTLSGKDMIISVAGGYLTGSAEGSIKLGNTVIFKAKIGCVNSASTSTTKEARLFEVASYKIISQAHIHAYGETVTVVVPATCVADGTGTIACACGKTKEVVIPATGSHTPNEDFVCSVCGKSALTPIDEAIEIGMSYEKGKYSEEYYYIQLTLDHQVNSTGGFARSTIAEGLYVTVNGFLGSNETPYKLGDTVIFKAKLGAANSALTTGGKELRLYEVAEYTIVDGDAFASMDGKSNIVTYNPSFADLTEVNQAPAGVTFDLGYLYVKKSGLAALENSALVWNTYGKYSTIAFDLYIDKITDGNGNAGTEVEFQLSAGANFLSVVDANGKEVTIVYAENPYVVLQKGKSYRIVVNVDEVSDPTFSFGWNNKTCELYFYNVSIKKSQYDYIIDDAEQTIVCKKDGETYGYFAWPTVTKLDGNRLIAVASGLRTAHIGTDGKVVAWYSEDGGKTWSEPQLVADTLLDDRDAGVVYWDGKIIVSWFAHSKQYYLNNNATKYGEWAATIDDAYDTKYMGGNYIISADGGKTWSEIYSMPDGMFTSHGLIVNPDGGLTSVGYLKYDKVNKRWGTGIAVRTTDGTMDANGFVWSDPIIIADSDTQYNWDFQEPYGVYNQDKVLIVVMRSNKGLYQCELQPGATAFGEWHKIANVQESPAHIFQYSNGVLVMTYGYRGIYVDENGNTVSYTERNKDTTLGIRALLSYDGGKTWTQEIILSSGLKPTNDNTSDWGYTSSVELSDGKILTLFYQRTAGETMASIYQIIWELPEAPEVTITFVSGKDGGDSKIATVTGSLGEDIVFPKNPTNEGYKFAGWHLDRECTIPFTATTYSKDLVVYAKWTVDASKVLPVMSFNVKVTQVSEFINNPRHELVVDTILENNPYVFGVQEADSMWMDALKSKLGHLYTAVGNGRDGGSSGEYSAIFYRTDMFTLIESGTKWLSNTPDTVSKYSYTENGTTYTANYNRIMTYVVLERKSDGARFIYVNTHLDNNGNNEGDVPEKIRQGEVTILLGEIKKLTNKYGNLPTIVTGDFNTQGVANNTPSYNAMINGGFTDSSRVAKEGEIKRTYNNNSESGNVIFDYIFVSSDLANKVQTYKVCDEKRDGKWISDHNAIIANVIIPKT